MMGVDHKSTHTHTQNTSQHFTATNICLPRITGLRSSRANAVAAAAAVEHYASRRTCARAWAIMYRVTYSTYDSNVVMCRRALCVVDRKANKHTLTLFLCERSMRTCCALRHTTYARRTAGPGGALCVLDVFFFVFFRSGRQAINYALSRTRGESSEQSPLCAHVFDTNTN